MIPPAQYRVCGSAFKLLQIRVTRFAVPAPYLHTTTGAFLPLLFICILPFADCFGKYGWIFHADVFKKLCHLFVCRILHNEHFCNGRSLPPPRRDRPLPGCSSF